MAETMIDLGEYAGIRCFWADPGSPAGPGFYIQAAGGKRRIWKPHFEDAGATVVSVREIPWEPGMRGLAVDLSNRTSAAFRLPIG